MIFWGFEINACKLFSAILIITETFRSYLNTIKIFTEYIQKNIAIRQKISKKYPRGTGGNNSKYEISDLTPIELNKK